jgi:hypothetical protein
MSTNDVRDLMDNYHDVVSKLDSIATSKQHPDITDKDFEELHRIEFELCMTESRIVRKIEKLLSILEKDEKNMFFVNRIHKELNKRGINGK